MAVPMCVRLGDRPFVGMQVMIVVDVGMFMLEHFVTMLVLMVLVEMRP